jgi:tetratricopeptide (TPR) repeat protein
MGIQRFRLAISRIESTTCPGEYADAHTKALTELAAALGEQEKWQEAIECAEQAVQVSASNHGCGHFTAQHALGIAASSYYLSGQHEKAKPLGFQALDIANQVMGPLSREAGSECMNIHSNLVRAGETVEAAVVCKQAIEAFEFVDGVDSSNAADARKKLKSVVNLLALELALDDPEMQEHWPADDPDIKTCKELRLFLARSEQGAAKAGWEEWEEEEEEWEE